MFCCGCSAGRGSRGARRDQWHGCLSSTRQRTPSRITFLTLLFWNNRFRVKVARGSVSCAHTRISWLPAKLRIIQEASFFGSLQCASVCLITDHQPPVDYVLDQARLAVYRCHVLFVPKGGRKGAEVVVGAHSALHAGRDFGILSRTVCVRARTLLLRKTPVVLVYGARLLLIISGVRISHLYKSTLWWAYLGAPDAFCLLKRPNPLRNG